MMTRGIAQISATTTREAEEPVAALLERLFEAPAAIYTSAETGESLVTVYARAPVAALKAREKELAAGLGELRALGLELGGLRIAIRRVPREDWSESWKKHFKTIRIGSALLIRPSWSRQRPERGQAVVVLDPGLSFGTGQHATTAFCLRALAAVARRRKGTLSLLDAGCGSGILAISAAKLGFHPVEAFDNDPTAVRIARKNCRANRVQGKVRVARRDLTRLPARSRSTHDVICANLMAPLLIGGRDRLLARLAPGGTLILAGILESEFQQVRASYEEAGLRLIRTKVEREWQSGAFRAPGRPPSARRT